jgi:hypothetical protein
MSEVPYGSSTGMDPVDRRLRLAQIHLAGARGVQIGDHNLQVDRYHVQVNASVDLASALRQGRVVRALCALMAAPQRSDLRVRAVGALTDPVWSGPGRTSFDLSAARTVDDSWWDWLLILRPQGVQIGDHSQQTNTFAYVISPTIEGAVLLAGEPSLAAALVDVICPPVPGSDDKAALAARMHDAVRAIGVDLDYGGTRALSRPAPVAGELLTLNRVDGAAVGSNNVQVLRSDINFSQTTLNTVDFRPRSAARPPVAEPQPSLDEPFSAKSGPYDSTLEVDMPAVLQADQPSEKLENWLGEVDRHTGESDPTIGIER